MSSLEPSTNIEAKSADPIPPTNSRNNRGKIVYTLGSDLDPRIFVGSTTQEANWILRRHLSKARDPKRTQHVYQVMRAVGIDSYKLVVVGRYPLASKAELEQEATAYLSNVSPSLLLNSKLVFGKRPSRLAGGSCFHSVKIKKWMVQWFEGDKRKSKSFGYGPCCGLSESDARQLAELFHASLSSE